MATQSERWKMLQELDEAEFRTDLLVPLLRKMGYHDVRERHGPAEYGKDITFREASPLGDQYHAVVAKAGPINAAASGKHNLNTVENQVDMAFKMPMPDVEAKKKQHVDRVIVWATGRISGNAQDRIIEGRAREFRNIGFKDGQATIELLEAYYPAFFTLRDPYVSDYYSGAKQFYSRLEELRTLGCSSEGHRLPAIFVPPRLRRYGEVPKVGGERAKKVLYSFSDVLAETRSTVIIGGVGSGKSTLLRRMLINIIEQNEQALRRSPIPILVELKRADSDDPDGLPNAINEEFLRFGSQGVPGESDTGLQDGSLIVLLDGLDELKTEDRITQAIEYIKDFNKRYPKTRVVLCSRPLEVFSSPDILSGYSYLAIEDLDASQRVRFVQNWYGEESPIAQKLVRLVTAPVALRGLPATPLTLALISILYQSGDKEIPANLTELFTKYVELVLGRWDVSRDVSVQYQWRVKLFVLRHICWHMHDNRQSAIARADLESMVHALHSARGLKVDPGAFCDELVSRSGLLLINDDDEYAFKHLSLQEYFVGHELDTRPDKFDLMVGRFLEPWWMDVIFFACGLRPDSDDYLNWIMEKVSPEGPENFVFAIGLGQVTQATYLATQQTKLRAIDCVLNRMIDAWDDFCSFYESLDLEEAKLRPMVPHLAWVGIFAGFAELALGSITLSTALSQRAKELASSSLDNLSPRDRSRAEWQAFLLGCACIGADNIEDFATLFSSGIITDPGFLLVGRAYAEIIENRAWLREDQKSISKTLQKKIGSKLKGLGRAVERLGRVGPITLPPPQEKEID